MKVKPLRSGLKEYLKRHNLVRKFNKQLKMFMENPRYPSLQTEKLEPKSLNIYSFRIDRKYRAIFITTTSDELETEAEIIDINDHYQ